MGTPGHGAAAAASLRERRCFCGRRGRLLLVPRACRTPGSRAPCRRAPLPHRRRRRRLPPPRSGEEGPASSGEQQPVKLLSVSVSAAPDVETAGLQLVKGQAVPAGQALHLQCELGVVCKPANDASLLALLAFSDCCTAAMRQPETWPDSPQCSPSIRPAAAAARQVMYNLPVEQMHAPVMGPTHHNQKSALAGAQQGRAAGGAGKSVSCVVVFATCCCRSCSNHMSLAASVAAHQTLCHASLLQACATTVRGMWKMPTCPPTALTSSTTCSTGAGHRS